VGLKSYSRVGRDDGVLRTLDCAPLAHLAMRNRLLDHYRQQTIASARGLVLEVGVGSGVNLPLYGPAVTRVVGLDPSPELLRLASKRAADVVIPVSLLRASAEHLPLADAVFDTIIMTWTLCSIPNPMRRSLKCGGFSGRVGD
jgi:ubiquinone/menaquinone biosynthesis C-methylase UbiE